jgi:hypothetical protein
MESAEWFAEMGQRRGREVDIWAVALDGQWLMSDPRSSGVLDDGWMIAWTPSRRGVSNSASQARLAELSAVPTFRQRQAPV